MRENKPLIWSTLSWLLIVADITKHYTSRYLFSDGLSPKSAILRKTIERPSFQPKN